MTHSVSFQSYPFYGSVKTSKPEAGGSKYQEREANDLWKAGAATVVFAAEA